MARSRRRRQFQPYPIHPLAEIPPRLSDEELQAMADDIQEYGQHHPIVLCDWNNGEGIQKVVADGRGRQQACQIAGVEPIYEDLPANVDIPAYIRSCALRRRNMTNGQKAMVDAMMEPDGVGPGDGRRDPVLERSFAQNSENRNAAYQSLHIARKILSFCEALPDDSPLKSYPDQVKNGQIPLRTAYKALSNLWSNEQQDIRRLREIRAAYPELTEQLDNDELTLAEAEALVRAIEEERQRALALRTQNPLLADRVSSGELSLAEAEEQASAIAANQERERVLLMQNPELVERFRNGELTLDEAEEQARALEEALSAPPPPVDVMARLVAAATDINNVLRLVQPIDITLPRAELEQQLSAASRIVDPSDRLQDQTRDVLRSAVWSHYVRDQSSSFHTILNQIMNARVPVLQAIELADSHQERIRRVDNSLFEVYIDETLLLQAQVAQLLAALRRERVEDRREFLTVVQGGEHV